MKRLRLMRFGELTPGQQKEAGEFILYIKHNADMQRVDGVVTVTIGEVAKQWDRFSIAKAGATEEKVDNIKNKLAELVAMANK